MVDGRSLNLSKRVSCFYLNANYTMNTGLSHSTNHDSGEVTGLPMGIQRGTKHWS